MYYYFLPMKKHILFLALFLAFAFETTTKANDIIHLTDVKTIDAETKSKLNEAKLIKAVRDIYESRNELDFSSSFLDIIYRVVKRDNLLGSGYLDHDILTQSRVEVEIEDVRILLLESDNAIVRITTEVGVELFVSLVSEDGIWKVDDVNDERTRMSSYLNSSVSAY